MLTLLKQAKKTLSKEKLGSNFDAVYSSTLSRCRKLASTIAENHYTDERLKELNFGDWEMQWWDKIPAEELLPWRKDFVNLKCPNGESYQDMQNRCVSFLDELTKTQHKKIAIISHGGFIRTLLSHVLHSPLEKSFVLKIDYGSVSKLEFLNNQYSVEYINH